MEENTILSALLNGDYDEPGNKVVADATLDEETGQIEVLWQCDKPGCNCNGTWREKQ